MLICSCAINFWWCGSGRQVDSFPQMPLPLTHHPLPPHYSFFSTLSTSVYSYRISARALVMRNPVIAIGFSASGEVAITSSMNFVPLSHCCNAPVSYLRRWVTVCNRKNTICIRFGRKFHSQRFAPRYLKEARTILSSMRLSTRSKNQASTVVSNVSLALFKCVHAIEPLC